MNEQILISRTRTGLGLMMMFLLGYAVIRFGGAEVRDQCIIQITVAMLLLLWVFLIWLDPRAIPNGVMSKVLLVAIVYVLGRGLFAKVRYLAFSDLAHFGMLVGLLLVVLGCAREKRWRRWLTLFLVFLAIGEALYALVQFASKSATVLGAVQPPSYHGRASGTYINPNHGAWLISMGVVVGLPLALINKDSWPTRIICAYAVVVCSCGLVVTFSRGALLAVGGVLLVFCVWWLWRQPRKWIGVVVLATMFLFASYAASRIRISSGFGHRHYLSDVRFVALWPAAVKVWKEKPIVGVGPGYFADCYRKYRPGLYVAQTDPVRVHNDYLNILVEWGLAGSIITFTLIGILVVNSVRLLCVKGDAVGDSRQKMHAFEVGGIMAALYALAHAASDFNLYLPANGLLTAMIVGLNWPRAAKDPNPNLIRRMLGVSLLFWSTLAIGLSGFLMVHAYERSLEHRYISASLAASHDFEAVRANLLAAHEICPENANTIYRLGEAYRRRGAEGAIEDADAVREGLRCLNMAVKMNSREPFYWIAKGKALHWLDRNVEASESFERALIVDPNNYRVESLYGWYMFELGRYAEAFFWLKRSQKLNYEENSIAKFYLHKLSQILLPENNWPPRGGNVMPKIDGLKLDELPP